MPFNSLTFLFGFGPLFFFVFYIASTRFRNYICLGFSLVFYAWAEPLFIFVVIASGILDYWTVYLFFPMRSGAIRKGLATFGVVQGLLILLYFKYSAFLYGAIAEGLGLSTTVPHSLSPLLPLAISF